MSKKWVVLSLPIEPIESRYSSQWDRWFDDAFRRNNIPHRVVRGREGKPPPPDKFLNPEATFTWKFTQLREAVRACEDRSWRYVVFLHDGWMPGVEMFPYLRDLDGLDVRVCAYWHAGSYDGTDLLGKAGCNKWAWGSETSWLEICDAVLVGSEYHKEKLQSIGVGNKIHVVGCPIQVPDGFRSGVRKPLVVWPHRLSADKNPEVFDMLSREPEFTGVEFVKTMTQNLSKPNYYRLLGSARVAVSTASHENFGIAMAEAAFLGCHPVCPRGLSYDETMEDLCLYHTYDEMVSLVRQSLGKTTPYEYPGISRFRQETVTNRVCGILKSLGCSS